MEPQSPKSTCSDSDTDSFNSPEARLARGLAPWTSVSFACGGWLQFYLFGVARAMQARGLDKDVKFLGCSAGALTAVGLALDGNFDDAVQFCKDDCVPKAYGTISGLFKLSEYVAGCIDKHVVPYYKDLPAGNLQVAITRLPMLERERITSFVSANDLKKCLIASSAAFPFAPLASFRGGIYIDGGVSDFQPIIDEKTITVSPIYFSNCDIKPSRYVPLWWSFLPPKSNDTIDWIYNLGWEDAMAFFDKKGIPSTHIGSKYDMKPIPKNDHPFDTPSQISVHRLLGYDLSGITHRMIVYMLDLVLMFQVFFIWKPLVLILIYLELVCYLCFHSVWVFVTEIIDFYTTLTYGKAVEIRDQMYEYSAETFKQLGDQLQQTSTSFGRYDKLWDIVTCMASLSLLMSLLSFKPNQQRIKKHHRLVRVSTLYRVFCFMI